MNLQKKATSYIAKNPECNIKDVMLNTGCQKSVGYAALNTYNHIEEIKKQKDVKNVVALGDLHCGHKAGLTPPEWFSNKHNWKLRQQQEEMWNTYCEMLNSVGEVDILFVNGDSLDGKGKRSGGTELLTTDRNEQCELAVRCIQEVNAKKIYMTYGTPYHTGNQEDFEDTIAKDVGAIIKDQLFVEINGLVFDVKHAIGSSSVPYSRGTAPSKAKTWNREWAEKNNQPKADIFLRSHVHYDNFTGNSKYIAFTLPALQAPDTKFGGRKCEATVSFGMSNFKIKEGDTVSSLNWQILTKELETFKQELLVA